MPGTALVSAETAAKEGDNHLYLHGPCILGGREGPSINKMYLWKTWMLETSAREKVKRERDRKVARPAHAIWGRLAREDLTEKMTLEELTGHRGTWGTVFRVE